MYYIQESDKLNYIYKKFNIIKLERNKIILPIIKEEKDEEKNKEKQLEKNKRKEQILAKKVKQIIENSNSNKIVISKEIKKHKTLLNELNSQNFDISNGRWLMMMLIPEILEKTLKQEKMKNEKTTIYILVNDVKDIVIENIKILVKKYKNICIITKHIEKFKKIEKEIFEKTGTAIAILNNKKKTLLKAKIIINIDFPTELINKYNINQESIIIDLQGNTKINKKSFCGKIIKDYEIEIKNKKEYYIEEELYYKKDLYESEFYKRQPYINIREKIKKDKIIIV